MNRTKVHLLKPQQRSTTEQECLNKRLKQNNVSGKELHNRHKNFIIVVGCVKFVGGVEPSQIFWCSIKNTLLSLSQIWFDICVTPLF